MEKYETLKEKRSQAANARWNKEKDKKQEADKKQEKNAATLSLRSTCLHHSFFK